MWLNKIREIFFRGRHQKYIYLVAHRTQEHHLPPYPIFLITDTATDIGGLPAGIEVVRHDLQLLGKGRENQVFLFFPERIKTALLPGARSEEHTPELPSQSNILCRLLLVIKKN